MQPDNGKAQRHTLKHGISLDAVLFATFGAKVPTHPLVMRDKDGRLILLKDPNNAPKPT